MNPLDVIINLLPIPKTLLEITWVLIGWQLGKSFGTIKDNGLGGNGSVDDYIRESGKWKGWSKVIVERTLYFLHHWEIGLLLIIYKMPVAELKWLGLGLFLEDSSFHLYDFLKARIKVK